MIFTNPAFLWGLLAVLIPIAVHLLNFHRYRTVYFSNVARLQELHTESRRTSNLRRWLLLALRILAIVFLVLAFAHPVIPNRESTTRSGNTVVSVFIDNTFSMESASQQGSLIDEGVRKARELVTAYGVGDRYQLLTADLSGVQMRWLSRDEFLDALDAVKPSAASPLLSDVVRRQLSFMASSGAANRHAYIISDFQRSAADFDALPADSLSDITFVPLQGTEADNLFIDTLVLDAPAYFKGGSIAVEVTVHNSGSHDAEKVPLKLLVGGHERALATVDVPAGGTAKVPLRFATDSAGWLDGSVTIEDYPVTFDDSYHFALLVGESTTMLELTGGTPNEWLARLFADDSTVIRRTAQHLPSTLADISFIVIDEVNDLPSGEAQQLAAWVSDGGTLLFIPKPGQPRVELPGIGITLSGWSANTVRAKAVNYGNSLYRGVFSATSDEMELPLVHAHYQSIAAPLSPLTSIISLADGSSLLSVSLMGAGRVYIFSAPLRDECTDLVNQALFVPTLYNMALYSRPQPVPCHTLGSGDPIVLQGTYDLNTPPQLSTLNSPLSTPHSPLSTLPDVRRVGDRYMLVPHGELTEAGIYSLSDEHLAFNHPRRESLMEFLTPGEVADAIEDRDGYSVVANAGRHLGDTLRAREGGHSLWWLCILLALAALAAETAILKLTANRKPL
ncbi:MAG: BatA domain-containing protein [Bacteroidales bacterium]|nr:BatA domain-containing protein [Bacteroidales bacterium]